MKVLLPGNNYRECSSLLNDFRRKTSKDCNNFYTRFEKLANIKEAARN